MEAKRLEFMLHEAGCLIMVAPMSLGGREYADLLEVFDDQQQLQQMIKNGAMMPMDLYQDDGYLVRVVVGELNEQEASEWTARVRWKLNIPCGQLLITGALDNEDGFEAVKDGDKFWLGGYVEVPAGEYGVEVCSYPPGDLSSGWGQIENVDGEGLFKPAHKGSRLKNRWIISGAPEAMKNPRPGFVKMAMLAKANTSILLSGWRRLHKIYPSLNLKRAGF